MQELRKNQELQEYIRMLERRTPPPDRAASAAKQVAQLSVSGWASSVWKYSLRTFFLCDSCVNHHFVSSQGSFRGAVNGTLSCPTGNPPPGPHLSPSLFSQYNSSSPFLPASSCAEARGLGRSQGTSAPLGDTQQEVQDLKEQLEALRCQVSCSLLTSTKKNVPTSDGAEAELMSSYCCQGKICLMLRRGLETDGK